MARDHHLTVLLLGALACSPQDAPEPTPPAPPGSGFQGDGAPVPLQLPVEACQPLTLEALPAEEPSARRSYGLTMPGQAQVLLATATWTGEGKRALVVGQGPCPPCTAALRRKGHRQIEVELSAGSYGLVKDNFSQDTPWFIQVEVDPDEHDLEANPASLSAQACRLRAETAVATAASLFPPQGLDPTSLALIEQDAFGFERLQQVHTARYQSDGDPLTAYVVQLPDAAAARALAADYQGFLVGLGGEVTPVEGLDDAGAVLLWDHTTVVLAQGTFVAGVQEASEAQSAVALAGELQAWLARSSADGE